MLLLLQLLTVLVVVVGDDGRLREIRRRVEMPILWGASVGKVRMLLLRFPLLLLHAMGHVIERRSFFPLLLKSLLLLLLLLLLVML